LPKLFNTGILQQIFKMSAVRRNTIRETLTPLLDLTALSMMRCPIN